MSRDNFNRELVARLQRQALADRMEAMQRLTAGFAHELRNPLNAARLQLEVLEQRSGGITPEHPAALARSELQAIADLIDDFLLFARPAPLAIEEHELVSLVSHAIDDERPFARDNGVEVLLIADLPPTQVAIDAAKVGSVFSELVHNAVEASPHGHVVVELEIAGPNFRATVRDDGPGIAPELHARIYEPFFTTRDHGRGLGLSIVHTFVALHRGSITMTSSPRGTRFEVTLPRHCD